jgi:hypothetical protein
VSRRTSECSSILFVLNYTDTRVSFSRAYANVSAPNVIIGALCTCLLGMWLLAISATWIAVAVMVSIDRAMCRPRVDLRQARVRR